MAAAPAEEPVDPSDELMFLCLGGGNEVGRSCHIIQYKGKSVMVRYCYLLLHGPLANDSCNSLMLGSTLHMMALRVYHSLTILTSAQSTYCLSASK